MALTKAQVREILSAAGVDSEHIKDAVEKIVDGHLAEVTHWIQLPEPPKV